MNHPGDSALLILLSSLLFLPACSGSGGVPDCLVFTPTHETIDGVIDVGTLLQGDVVEDVVAVETTGIEGAPSGSVFIDVQWNCDDPMCEPDFLCAPGTLDPVGQTITCDVVDNIEGPECSWSCQLSLTATVLDDGVCQDVFTLAELAGEHLVPILGR